MDPLDLFFKKYVYKFPKGYPDLNDEQDINLLADILENMEINLNEVKTLRAVELKKRENLNTFLKKFYDKKPFEAINGNVILNQIKVGPNTYTFEDKKTRDELYNQIFSSPKSIIYVEGEYENGTEFKGTSGKLIKTEEFGGLSKDFISKETQALNKGIENFPKSDIVNIQVGNIISKDCKGLFQQPQSGKPKADFYIEGKPKIYISHKDGNSAKDFYRWGGISAYKEHEEVKSFIEYIKDNIENNEFKSGQSFYRKIEDTKLKQQIVYGKDFDQELFNENNVNCVIQGNIEFDNIGGNLYELKGNKMWLNGEIPSGDYEPILFATYRSNRNDFQIKNSEILSIPLARAEQSAIEIPLPKENQPTAET
jgi:hypothetical protein